MWAILIGISAVATFGVYQQIIKGEPFGDNAMSDAGLITFAISMYSLPVLFWLIHIETEIDNEQIKLNFAPFLKKSVELVAYGSVGGWGVKHSKKYGTVYATGGDMGLAIEIKSGSKFVISTQNESELKAFLEKSDLSSES